MSSTARREREITYNCIRGRVQDGPKMDVYEPFPDAFGGLLAKTLTLFLETARERDDIYELLNTLIVRLDREPQETVELENEADRTADVADGWINGIREKMLKETEGESSQQPSEEAKAAQDAADKALLDDEESWPTLVKVMSGVVEDLRQAQHHQAAICRTYFFVVKKEAVLPRPNPYKTDAFKAMERETKDLIEKHYEKEQVRKLIGFLHDMIGSVVEDLGRYSRIIDLIGLLDDEHEKRRERKKKKKETNDGEASEGSTVSPDFSLKHLFEKK